MPYVANPRQITDKQAKDLKASLDKFGLADPLIVNTNNDLIGGHQRKKILETLMGADPDFEVDVRVPDRELTIDEMRELNVRLNKNVAEWNFDTLANNFELDDLREWGFEEYELGNIEVIINDDNLSGGNYGDVSSKTTVPINILGIGGLVDRELMENVKRKLLDNGAMEGGDNGGYIEDIFSTWIIS